MTHTNSKILRSLMGEFNLKPAHIEKALGSSQRSTYAWLGTGDHSRDMPTRELERLCMMLDRGGYKSATVDAVLREVDTRTSLMNI